MSLLLRNWGSVDVVIDWSQPLHGPWRTKNKWWSQVFSTYGVLFKKVQFLLLLYLYGFFLLASEVFSVFSSPLLTHTYTTESHFTSLVRIPRLHLNSIHSIVDPQLEWGSSPPQLKQQLSQPLWGLYYLPMGLLLPEAACWQLQILAGRDIFIMILSQSSFPCNTTKVPSFLIKQNILSLVSWKEHWLNERCWGTNPGQAFHSRKS